MSDKRVSIIEACKKEKSINPFEIFFHVAANDFVNIHGPEHHVLDGACVLTAFYNAGGRINLDEALDKLLQEGVRMPGAACGLWGVCGAVTSIGAALAIIDGTGPLSTDGSWDWHMRYTSEALARIADVGGPRCCKRDAFLAMKTVIPYVKEKYRIQLEDSDIVCSFSALNQQCLRERCPFYRSTSFEIRDCDNYDIARALIREYSAIKGAEKCFVSLDKELTEIDEYYKGGALLIGYENGKPIATVAFRNINGHTCEAKRLYIKPEYRGKGYARLLINTMLDRCRKRGFREVVFTTKPSVMNIGYGLYQRMGFQEVSNDKGTVTMRMSLG